MKERKLYKFAVDTFIKVISQIQRQKFHYQCDDRDVSAWDNFVESRKVNEDIVRNVVEFGVQYYFCSEYNTQRQKESIRFSWIFGKKPIERWLKNDVKTNNYIIRKTLKKQYKINTVKRNNQISKIVLSLRKIEEKYKAEFFNTKRGFQWCIANTSLYHHKSTYCLTCEFKQECKEILKRNYNNIYKLRGYGNE